MDRKSLIILLASFGLLYVVFQVTNRMFPPVPAPHLTNQVSTTGSTNRLTPEIGTNRLAESLAPARGETEPRTYLSTNIPERTLTVENPDVRYTFTSHGGGLKLIELKKYPATVECRKRTAANEKQAATLNGGASAPILAILDGAAVQGDGIFNLSKTPQGVRAEKDLTNGLRIIKDFEPSTNYLLKASVRLENRSGKTLALPSQEWVIGTAAPMGLRDESMMLGLEWYDGSQAHKVDHGWFANRTLGCFPGRPRTLFEGGNSNVVWAAAYNQFFTLIAVPGHPGPELVGRQIDLPPPSPEQVENGSHVNAHPFGFEAALVYPQTHLEPNQVEERTFELYSGPKEYNTLARLPKNLDLIMGFGGFFGFFAKGLLLSMNGLHALSLPYGVTIIVITVVIKLFFWPLTQASTRSMKRMQELQPQMKALQEKYKDDPRKMNTKLMEFMRENKVSPLGGCLPMLLQIPVFFGFYRMLQTAIELRGARFLWACDLSQPDTIWMIPGMNFPVNPLPLVMGATMLWQARLTPPSPGMDPMQQKLMRYMPLIFMLFLYNFSAGLTLYWTVQNLLTIAQMKLTRSKSPGRPAGPNPAGPLARPPGPRKTK